MFDWYSIMLAARLRHEEIGRIAEQQRLRREVIGARPRRLPAPRNILLTVGCWLVERSWQFQQETTGVDALEWGRLEIRARRPGPVALQQE
jgi:hypothetical protein